MIIVWEGSNTVPGSRTLDGSATVNADSISADVYAELLDDPGEVARLKIQVGELVRGAVLGVIERNVTLGVE